MTVHAAGILFTTPDRKALFLLRGHGGDFPLQWCLPGGKIEDGETPEQAAEREAVEECGPIPEGINQYLARSQAISAGVDPNGVSGEPGQAVAGETVDFTTFTRRVAEQFTPVQDDEHTGHCWAPINAPPQPLHPGVAIVLRRVGANELQVARMIAAGELTSPQRFENMLIYAMRMSGTGVAYRQGLDEFVHRDPAIWLSQDMIDRCAGVPLIWEHPQGSVLNSKEFANRVIGSVMFGYVKDADLWCVVRVYDDEAIKLMEEDQLSTSPAVVFRDPSANKHLTLEGGEALLIEGNPSYIDHLAVCAKGVWDKGAEATGVTMADSDYVPQADAEFEESKHPRADASDKTWASWRDWNDEYVALLKKWNAAKREHDKATAYGADSPKTAAKVERTKLAVDEHSNHPNRPNSTSTRVFGRRDDARLDSALQSLTLTDIRMSNLAASRRR